MTTAVSGFGASISIGATDMVECTSIGIPGRSRELIDVTNHDSTGGYREFISSLRDGSEFTVTMNYIAGSASDDAIIAAFASETVTAIEIVAKSAAGTEDITFNGFITGYTPEDLAVDSAQTATVTIKPTGVIAQAATV